MKIEIVGKFYDNQSLSIVNRNIALNLKDTLDIKILPLDSFNIDNKVNIEQVKALNSMSIKEEQEDVDIQIRHSYPVIWGWPKFSKTKIVYIQPWEFMAIPSEWQYKFDTFADAIITPSVWTTNVYLNSGINPNKIYTIPNGYNPKIHNTENAKRSLTKRFLYVGCHQYRKGVDVLLRAWAAATKNISNVELIIKDTPQVYGQSNLQSDIIKIQYNTKCGKITYLDSIYSEQEMADLYKSCDFIIHPYRGEGFGMHILEAEQCGVISIVTAGGPTDEFAKGISINSSKQIVNMQDIFAIKPGDSMSLMGQHKWVLEPDVNHLVEIIKHVIVSKDMPTRINNAALTWEQVASKYVEVLTTINELSDTVVRK
jgi:glycosyltransferase involved in cell wall biosynthesis